MFFDDAIKVILEREGKYSIDKDDPGGETYRGISRRYHPGWSGWILIDEHKEDKYFPHNLEADGCLFNSVITFYKRVFWDRFQGDLLKPYSLCLEIFDTSVHEGVTQAVTFLQESLSILNRDEKLFPDLLVDGKLGPVTISALNVLINLDEIDILLLTMNIRQGNYLFEKAEENPVKEKYIRGWLKNRVENDIKSLK